MKKNEIVSKTIIYIVLAIMALAIIVPLVWLTIASFKQIDEFSGASTWLLPRTFYFQNYINAFVEGRMGVYLLNSIIVTGTALILLLLLAVPASYAMARYDFFGKKVIVTMFMAGLFVNISYIVIPLLIQINGWQSLLQNALGIEGDILINNHFMLALIYASTSLPFTTYLMSNYFKTIPNAYREAAEIDGYGHFQIMTKIMIPMAKPSIITVILFSFLAYWNEYIMALTLLTDESKRTLPVGLTFLQGAERTLTDYGKVYAGLVIVMLPTLILYIIIQKKITEGMTLGGLKD